MATPTRTCITVHPHACGEIHAFADTYAHYGGTSPRLWGDCRRCPKRRTSVRYIPTPVGRFKLYRQILQLPTVHPHACGEIIRASHACCAVDGTSPRLWGDFFCTMHPPCHIWYIPTPVGRFSTGSTIYALRSVHPHRLWGDSTSATFRLPFTRYIPTPVGRLFRRALGNS